MTGRAGAKPARFFCGTKDFCGCFARTGFLSSSGNYGTFANFEIILHILDSCPAPAIVFHPRLIPAPVIVFHEMYITGHICYNQWKPALKKRIPCAGFMDHNKREREKHHAIVIQNPRFQEEKNSPVPDCCNGCGFSARTPSAP